MCRRGFCLGNKRGVLMLNSRIILIPLMLGSFSMTSFAQESFHQEKIEIVDPEIIDILTNPELHSELSIRKFALQNLFLLPLILSLPDTAETCALKKSAAFFCSFYLGDPSEIEHIQIEDKIYVRMPRECDQMFKSSILKFMEKIYTEIDSKWSRLGFEPPNGFIYVWFLSKIEEMQYKFGTKEGTRAFALPCRYIVVPYRGISEGFYRKLQLRAFARGASQFSHAFERFLEEDFKEAFSHELAHVFIFSHIGFERLRSLDKWFSEGVAIWFSGGDESLTEEYKGYKHIFDFIRMKYGNKLFISFVKESINTSPTQGLKAILRISSYEQLCEEVEKWDSDLSQMQIVISVLVVIILIIAFRRWMKGKTIHLFILTIASIYSFYYWRYGTLNLWTDSIVASSILNAIAILITFITPVEAIRYFYYGCVLRKEIGTAKNEIEMAKEARAELYAPNEFDISASMLSEAKNALRKGKYRKGINYATNAKEKAREAASTAAGNKIKMKCEAEKLLSDLKKAAEKVNDDIFLSWLNQKLEEIQSMMKKEDFARAAQMCKNIIETIDL
jgi:hypothetical protein